MIERIKDLVKKFNPDYYEICLAEGESTSISIEKKEVEAIGKGKSCGGSLRLMKNGGWGFISFNNFDELQNKMSAYTVFDKLDYYNRKKMNLNINSPIKIKTENTVDIDFTNISLEDKLENCIKYNNILLKNKKLISTRVSYTDRLSDYTLITSEGSEIQNTIKFCGILISAVAKDGMNIQSAYFGAGDLSGYGIVLNLQDECEIVIKRTLDLLKAKPVQPGIYTVITDQKLTGVFTHEAFGHLSEADFIYENPDFKKIMKIGKRFAPENVNIIDDPTIEGLAGSYLYDSEGTPTKKNYLIKNGILEGRLHSKETAVKMKESPTGNARAISFHNEPIVRMSNTYLDNGIDKFEDVINETSDGIYAKGALGGMTNTEMFTFSSEEAYLIKDGKITEMLRDVVLSGNVFKTLQNIDKVCDDLKFYGGLGGCGKGGQSPLRVSDGGPHIRIKDVRIGGK